MNLTIMLAHGAEMLVFVLLILAFIISILIALISAIIRVIRHSKEGEFPSVSFFILLFFTVVFVAALYNVCTILF